MKGALALVAAVFVCLANIRFASLINEALSTCTTLSF